MEKVRLCAFADEAASDLDGQIAAMLRNRIPYLEIRGINHKNVTALTLDEVKEVKKKLDENGLAVWSIGSPLGKMKPETSFDDHLDDFKRTVEKAYLLGCRRIRMFSFYPEPGKSAEENRDISLNRLRAFDEATPVDILLCHENEKAIYGETAETCLDILRMFPRMRAVFDPANFVQCGVNTAKAWDILAPYVDYFHIKDALADGRVVPAGHGNGQVETVLRKYLANGGSVMTLEPHLKEFVGLADLEVNGESVRGGTNFSYKTNGEAFDAAVTALRVILDRIGAVEA